MNTQQSMEYLEQVAEEEQEEKMVRLERIFGGRSACVVLKKLYAMNVDKLSQREQADFYVTAFQITQAYLPELLRETE